MQAPFLVPVMDGQNTPADESFGWWRFNEAKTEYAGVDESVARIRAEIAAHGPFDGLLGFSQGATMTAVMAHLTEGETPAPFRFVMCFCGFQPRDDVLAPALAARAADGPKIAIPSMHVLGLKDTLIVPERARALAAAFADPIVIESPDSGHFIPTGGDFKAKYRAFLDEQAAAASSL